MIEQPFAYQGAGDVEAVEVITQGRYRAILRRRDDGLLEVLLEKWIDGPAEGFAEEGTYWTPLTTALSKTDTLDIARSLARALLEDRC